MKRFPVLFRCTVLLLTTAAVCLSFGACTRPSADPAETSDAFSSSVVSATTAARSTSADAVTEPHTDLNGYEFV